MIKFLGVILCLVIFASIGSAQDVTLESGVKAYTSGDHLGSINILKKVTKEQENLPEAWYYLGLAYLGAGRPKDAVKPFERSVKQQPDNAAFRSSLSYAYLTVWDRRAENTAKDALKKESRNELANFVLAVTSLRARLYEASAQFAKKALDVSPKFRGALLIRSKALVALFASEPYPPVHTPEIRVAMLDDAANHLDTYLQLDPKAAGAKEHTDYLNSIRYFADYYRRPGRLNQPRLADEQTNAMFTPMRILRKTAPEYTPFARSAGVEGTSILIVEFRQDGKMGHVLVGAPLEDSLDNAAVEAAKKIKFTPAVRYGKAETNVRRVEYSFGFR